MFKKRREAKALRLKEKQIQEDKRRKERDAKLTAKEKEKADKQAKFDKYFEDKDLSILFDEVAEKMDIIETAVEEDDHTLTNERTGKARNIRLNLGAKIQLKSLSGHYTWTSDSTHYPLFKKGDNSKETLYKCLIGSLTDSRGDMFDHNFKEVYLMFKTYEKKFPESLLLRFRLTL